VKSLSIFVHSASHCLTDHQSYGEGLICFSLLNGLAKRGHNIYVNAIGSDILEKNDNLYVKNAARPLVPFDSLVSWERNYRGDQLLYSLRNEKEFDIVWYMAPCGTECPSIPRALGKPLVIGPLYYGWPENKAMLSKPRFGIGIRPLVLPFAKRGWQRTLASASLIICSTPKHADSMQLEFPKSTTLCLPLIVEQPNNIAISVRTASIIGQPFNLVFVANLVPNKYPMILAQAVKKLKENGLNIRATYLGDGIERENLEKFIAQENLEDVISLKGRVPNKDIHEYLINADLLISTSLGEPYGRNIAEAMCVGTPAVCHNSGGPAEIVENGVDGILVDELTGDSFARAIAQVYNDRDLWQSFSNKAILKSQNWTSDAILVHLERALLNLCTKTSRQ